MIRVVLLAAAVALSACSTLPQVIVTGPETFDVRFDQGATSSEEADARAATLCNGPPQFVSSAVKFDGLTYRSYRCHRK